MFTIFQRMQSNASIKKHGLNKALVRSHSHGMYSDPQTMQISVSDGQSVFGLEMTHAEALKLARQILNQLELKEESETKENVSNTR